MSDNTDNMGVMDMVQAGVRSGEMTITMVDDTNKVWELRVPSFTCDPVEQHQFDLDIEVEKFDCEVDSTKSYVINTMKMALDLQVSTLSITQVGVRVGDQVVKLEGLEG